MEEDPKAAKSPVKKEVKAKKTVKEEAPKKASRPPLELKDLTVRNVHGFTYNSFGPENPYPQRETHGHSNDHYDQRLAQGVPVHVNPVLIRDTMGDAKLDMNMVVGPDDIELKKKSLVQKRSRGDFNTPWKTPLDVSGKTPNQWDDTIHQDDGVRTFRDGVPLQYPNWQAGQFIHNQRETAPIMDVTGKEVNRWDASVHFENGTRAMPDGT